MGVVVALLVIAAGIVALSLIVRSFGSGEDRSVRSYSEALYTLKEIQEHRIGAMPLANGHDHNEAPDHVHPHVEKLKRVPGRHVEPRPLRPVPIRDQERAEASSDDGLGVAPSEGLRDRSQDGLGARWQDGLQDRSGDGVLVGPPSLSESPVAKEDPTRMLPVFSDQEEPTVVVPAGPNGEGLLDSHLLVDSQALGDGSALGPQESEAGGLVDDGRPGRARVLLGHMARPSMLLGFLVVALAAALVALLVSSGGPSGPTRAAARVQAVGGAAGSSRASKTSGTSQGTSTSKDTTKATKATKATKGSSTSRSGVSGISATGTNGASTNATGNGTATGTNGASTNATGSANASLLATASSSEAAATYEVPSSIAPPGAPMHIVIQAVGARCWVEVTSGSGPSAPLLFTGTLPAGASQSVSSSGTVWMRLGAAYNVSVTVNGVPVTLPSPHLSPFDVTLVQG
jgi:hypothetical protein